MCKSRHERVGFHFIDGLQGTQVTLLCRLDLYSPCPTPAGLSPAWEQGQWAMPCNPIAVLSLTCVHRVNESVDGWMDVRWGETYSVLGFYCVSGTRHPNHPER